MNKVSSKIELTFNLGNSISLSDEEKELLKTKLSSKLSKENILILFCDDTRSQHKNKEIVIKRFLVLLKLNLIIPKKRKKTKPSKASVKKRLENKKKLSEKKNNRKNYFHIHH